MKPPKNFNQCTGDDPNYPPLPVTPFELSNIQSALNRGSFMRMPSNGSVPTSTKKFGWGGVLSAGLGMVGNVISTAMTNRANREMQREANEQNERLWREQMEYNSPASQMARFKQAGLNPNLAYGDNGNAGAPPEYVSSRNQAPQVDPMAISNALLIKKQLDLADAERENVEADTRQKNAFASGQENENSVFDKKFDLFVRETNSRIGLNEKEATLKFRQGQTEYQNYIAKQLDNYFKSATMDERIKAIQKQNNLTDEQIKVAKSAVSKAYAEISYLRKQGQLIDSKILTEAVQRAYLGAQTDLTVAQKEQVLADTQLKGQIEKYYIELTDKTAQDRRVGEVQEETMKSNLEWQRQKTGQSVGGLIGSIQMGMVGAVEIMGSLF